MSLSEFLANPRTFLDANVVLPPGRGNAIDFGSHRQSGVFKFAFVASTSATAKMPNGSICPLYRVEPVDNHNKRSASFDAYFCFYEPNQLHLLVVDGDAPIMLTPSMNGCSFGIGSSTPNGARLVGHANVHRVSSDSAGIAKQVLDQAQLLEAGGLSTIMGPNRYLEDAATAGTTIGVRQELTKQWKFFTQVWRRVGGENVYSLIRVEELA